MMFSPLLRICWNRAGRGWPHQSCCNVARAAQAVQGSSRPASTFISKPLLARNVAPGWSNMSSCFVAVVMPNPVRQRVRRSILIAAIGRQVEIEIRGQSSFIPASMTRVCVEDVPRRIFEEHADTRHLFEIERQIAHLEVEKHFSLCDFLFGKRHVVVVIEFAFER